MAIWNKRRIERKSSSADVAEVQLRGHAAQILEQIAAGDGTGLGLSSNYMSQLIDGYASNPYVAKCVDLRASAVAALKPVLLDPDGNEIDDPSHPLARLLQRPNPRYSWKSLIYEVAGDIALNGNGFIEPVRSFRGIEELWYARAGDVTPIPAVDRFYPVRAWQVSSHGVTTTLEPDGLIHILGGKRGQDDILAVSPLASARLSVTQQTEARKWNVSLMRNGAKPSVAIMSPKRMSDPEFKTFADRLRSNHTGDKAGSTMVLDDGKTISTAGFNARDMDYAVGVTTSAREIAIALHVPPELVGDSANKTYSNAQEANREFALQTIIPDADFIYDELTRVLAPAYDDVDRIGYDTQQIEALRGSEVELLTALNGAEFLTTNEKRARLAYDAVPGGDTVLVSMGKGPLSEMATPIEDLMGGDGADADGL